MVSTSHSHFIQPSYIIHNHSHIIAFPLINHETSNKPDRTPDSFASISPPLHVWPWRLFAGPSGRRRKNGWVFWNALIEIIAMSHHQLLQLFQREHITDSQTVH